jgi:hypothetical protein
MTMRMPCGAPAAAPTVAAPADHTTLIPTKER